MTARLPIGDVFAGRYRVDELLGQGGYGSVYRAWDTREGLAVAVKALGIQSDEEVRRVDREVAVLRRLSSPHVVRLLDDGFADGVRYLVFELLGGEDLARLLASRDRLDADLVVHLLRQLLEGLRVAHDAGMLHRDIKPQNIRVVPRGADREFAVLMDFGIARPTDDGSPAITATGDVVGTPRYMSPEQLLNRPLMPSSDLYSLGLVAIECLLERQALRGNHIVDQIARLRTGYVFGLGGLEHYGRGLLRVLTRMTARDPADRFPSATAVLSALNALDHDPTRGPRPTTAPSRSPSRGWIAAAAGIVGASIGVAAYLARDQPAETAPVRVANPVGRVERVATVPSHTAPPAVDMAPDTDGGEPGTGCGLEPSFRGYGSLPLSLDTTAYIPEAYDPDHRHPMIVLLHDDWEDPGTLLKSSGFPAIADERQVVVLAPHDGMASVWRRDAAEAPRLRALFEFAQAELCLDPQQLFVVGQGHGGSPVHYLMCEPWIRAVAMNARPFTGASCRGDARRPILFMYGTNNPGMPQEGGYGCSDEVYKRPLDVQERMLREQQGCAEEREEWFVDAGGKCYAWECAVPLVSCRVDGGRAWPNSVPRIDGKNCDGKPAKFPAAIAAWRFFDSVRAAK